MFFGLSRGNNQLITIQEADFYHSIAIKNTNPFDLRQLAYSYLLDARIDDEKIIVLQKQMITGPDVHPDFKIKALKNLTTSNVNGLEKFLLADLANPDSGIRLEVANTLGRIGGQEQIPELMKIALDETKDLTSRSLALLTIEDIVRRNGIDSSDKLVVDLEPLLKHKEYTIRVATADVLELLTDKTQEIKAMPNEIDDYMSNTFLGNY